jgi:hypothetical protein
MIVYILALIFPLFAFVYGAFLIFKGTKRFLLVQKIENTPASNASSAAVGLVELHGKAEGGKILKSPISDSDCVFWAAEAHQQDPSTGNYQLIAKTEARSPFDLNDPSGRLIVDPTDAELELSELNVHTSYLLSMSPEKTGAFDSTFQRSKSAGESARGMISDAISGPSALPADTHHLPNEKIRAFLLANQSFSSSLARFSGRNVRITEYTIKPGQELFIIGSLDIQPKHGVKMCKGRSGILFISDKREPDLVRNIRFDSLKSAVIGWVLLAVSVTLFIFLSQSILP